MQQRLEGVATWPFSMLSAPTWQSLEENQLGPRATPARETRPAAAAAHRRFNRLVLFAKLALPTFTRRCIMAAVRRTRGDSAMPDSESAGLRGLILTRRAPAGAA